jgi:hypothetical protein
VRNGAHRNRHPSALAEADTGEGHVINLQPPWLADGVFGENIRASRNNLPVDCFAADLNDLSGALVNREIDGEYGGLLTH